MSDSVTMQLIRTALNRQIMHVYIYYVSHYVCITFAYYTIIYMIHSCSMVHIRIIYELHLDLYNLYALRNTHNSIVFIVYIRSA